MARICGEVLWYKHINMVSFNTSVFKQREINAETRVCKDQEEGMQWDGGGGGPAGVTLSFSNRRAPAEDYSL